MNKAKQVVDLLNEGTSNVTGYSTSYSGWKSLIKRSANEVVDGFQHIYTAFNSEDEKKVQRAAGYVDGLLDELIKNAEGLKKVNAQLLRDMKKPEIQGSDFWRD